MFPALTSLSDHDIDVVVDAVTGVLSIIATFRAVAGNLPSLRLSMRSKVQRTMTRYSSISPRNWVNNDSIISDVDDRPTHRRSDAWG